MFSTRPITELDIDKAYTWQQEWGVTPIEKKLYPKKGLMLYYGDKESMLGFLWSNDSAMAKIGFITRNPSVKQLPKQTKEILIRSLIDYAKELGYEYIGGWVADSFLKQAFRDIGFAETSNNVSEFLAKIN